VVYVVAAPALRPYTTPESGPGAGGGGNPTLNVNLVAHWHLDEIQTNPRLDAVTGSYAMAPNGAVTQSPGKVGTGFSAGFSAGSYLNAGAFPGLNFAASGQFELNLWCYFTALGTPFVFNLATVGSNRSAAISYSGTATAFRCWANSTQLDNIAFGAPALNTWYNVSVGDDGTQAFLYINNGSLLTGAHVAPSNPTEVSVNVGCTEVQAQPLSGRVDCISLWIGRALTTAERTALYNGGAGLEYPY